MHKQRIAADDAPDFVAILISIKVARLDLFGRIPPKFEH